MAATQLSTQQRGVVEKKVSEFLGRVKALGALAPAERAEVVRSTAAIVESLAAGPRRPADPYDLPGLAGALADTVSARGTTDDASHPAPGTKIDGGAAKLIKDQGGIGTVIGAGVTQAARMVNEIDFPTFVAKLIEGTFHAIVKSSIEQMRAYAEMVKSVSTSLNDFKDQNTTQNQARDHLVRKYPQLFQINIVDSQPKVQVRDGADTDNLPDFQKELGMAKEVTDLDDETIENDLVPAAQDDLARGRQQLLATIILMGINRIIVTDGKINAKIKFQFSANEKRTLNASAFDYAYVGQKTDATANEESQYTGQQYSSQQGQGWNYTGPNSYAKGQYETTVEPDVRVTSQVDLSSEGAIQASGQIMGEVSVNFKSESFPLEKMVDTDQMMRLQQAQGPRAGAPAAATSAPAGSAPLPPPPATAQPATTQRT
jgi:hypothetical protein